MEVGAFDAALLKLWIPNYERSTITGLHPELRLGSCHNHSTHDLERDIMVAPISTSQMMVPY